MILIFLLYPGLLKLDKILICLQLIREFFYCFMDCGWLQWVDFGTFFPSGNTLDLVFSSDGDRVGEVHACSPLPGCHHSPVMGDFIFPFGVGNENVRSMKKLAWNKGDFSKITAEFYEVDWEAIFRGLNVHNCYKLFLGYIQESVDRHVPIRGPPINGIHHEIMYFRQ